MPSGGVVLFSSIVQMSPVRDSPMAPSFMMSPFFVFFSPVAMRAPSVM